MTVNSRIEQLIKTVYGSQASAARALKVSRQRINAVVGGLKPGLEFYIQLSDNIERLNLNWLMKGEGPMFVNWENHTESDKILVTSGKDKMFERIINIWDAERKQWESVKRDHFEILKEIRENQKITNEMLIEVRSKKRISKE